MVALETYAPFFKRVYNKVPTEANPIERFWRGALNEDRLAERVASTWIGVRISNLLHPNHQYDQEFSLLRRGSYYCCGFAEIGGWDDVQYLSQELQSDLIEDACTRVLVEPRFSGFYATTIAEQAYIHPALEACGFERVASFTNHKTDNLVTIWLRGIRKEPNEHELHNRE